ncbi:MAG TPA: AGE family epimerase/isomerase [Solirubrobacteraceae bacterium]|jgi:sulfoquinovose isomerase|nr:AGE family epimerase/isomerase [Solirubrobacteraceae bacterium]
MSLSSSLTWRRLPSHRAWLGAETGRLLEFGRGARVEQGFGWLDAAGTLDPRQPLQLWITTRMTYVFALGHLLGIPGCGPLADHGLRAVEETFEDREHGGWFAEVSGDGPLHTRKEAYSHAFVLLATASATIAARPGAQQLLDRAADVVERRFWSEAEGACAEARDRDWRESEAYRGANANMHMVEAFLAAADATGDPAWGHRALRVAERLIRDVAGAHDWRVVEHFDAAWTPLPDYNRERPRDRFRPFGVTPGHGLEWSRLLLHLHAALPSPPDWLVPAARGLFARAVDDGWQEPGGFVYTTDLGGRPVVSDRLHWVVAEEIGAAAALHEVTGGDDFERWYRTGWDFADAHLRDRRRGSWRHELDEQLQAQERTWTGKPDVYHALQATLLPRVPVTASLAGALRDDLLS